MTRTSGGRLAAAIIVGLAVLPLSGCLYAQIPEHPTIVDHDPAPTAEPTDGPIDEPSAESMSFADGAALSPSAYVEWGDGFFADSAWQIVKPDDGNGGWTYGTVDGTCTAEFWQGHIDSIMTAGDDSVSSDAMMATFLGGGTTTAEITPLASTSGFSYQTGGNTEVENRVVSGSGDGVEWTLAARAFTAVGVGLYVVVDCTGGDIDAVWNEVVSKNAIVITG